MSLIPHILDRPAWNALRTRQAPLALGDGQALRLSPEYGPFAGSLDRSPEALQALARLDPSEDGLWVVETEAFPAPPGMVVAVSAPCVQMVCEAIEAPQPDFEVIPLTEADAPEMLALAKLTRPGPFSTATHRLGEFIGVKHDGKLVAMAGERMKPDGFTEVSGVCTHPDHRGRGYAAGLMRLVTGRILERGDTAFLHAYATNTGAIALYETLGFRHRTTVILSVLKRGEAA
jgi:predicted GNAT family acetyltransferase